nr:NepR family anti-sigma factor [Novosphingobium sediminicola]
MEWDKPVKEVPPFNADGAKAVVEIPAPSPSVSPQASTTAPPPAWSQDIRAYYHAAAEEPVPQDFVDLMAQIAKQIEK